MVVLTVVPANFVVAARGWIFFLQAILTLRHMYQRFLVFDADFYPYHAIFGEARFFQSLAYQPAYYRIKALSLPMCICMNAALPIVV